MTLAEALAAVAEGKRVRSPTLSLGWVIKAINEGWQTKTMVVHEVTGSMFRFSPWPVHVHDDWQLVEGWA